MAEEIELLEVQDIPAEEGAGIDADSAEDVQVIDFSWLISSMEEKLVTTYPTKSSPFTTICRVPANIRKCDHAAYNPKIVSIGPFHRRRKNLRAMEEHKWRYLHEVLTYKPENNLEKFLKEMKAIEMQARNYYSGEIQMRSNKFVEMMVLDGCFIISLFLQQLGKVKIDVLISNYEMMSRLIHHDMLLLENQLPFFILECLWELIGEQRDTLRNGALASFNRFLKYELEMKSPAKHDIHHLLHLLHLSFQPDSPSRKSQTTSASGKQSSSESQHKSPQPWDMIPSATELREAGVRFKLKEKARSFFEVGFKQGLMEMSPLRISDQTNILFRNFIAFEQCFPDQFSNHFTSYCNFMDFLVNTPTDVSILSQSDIIKSGLGSNEEVALLFNKLCKGIVYESGYLANLCEQVNDYTNKCCSKRRARLVRDYFSNRWAIISLIAAVIILILTLSQTFFSVFAYFNPPKS